MKTVSLMWLEEQFREDYYIVYRVRSLSYPNSIALIKVSQDRYKIFHGEYDLTLGEIIRIYKLAKARMDDYNNYSS
jgi:hypothetical protein